MNNELRQDKRAELTEDELAVLSLRAQGFSYNEIGSQLNLSTDSVNQKLNRATLKIMYRKGAKSPVLSIRERQMLELLEAGVKSYAELCEKLGVGRDRVKSLIWSLKRKGWIKARRIDSGKKKAGKNTSFSENVKKSGKNP